MIFINLEKTIIDILPEFISRRIKGRKNLQKILANTGWLFLDKVVRMGIGLFVWVWIARYLGAEQFGILSYAMAFVALFGAFSNLGMDGIVVRDIVKEPEHTNEILGSTFILRIVGGLSALVLTILVISFMRPNDTLTIWLVGIISIGFVFLSFDTIDLHFQSQVQSKYTVYAKNGAFIIVSIIKIYLILIKAPLIAFAWAALAEIAIGSLFMTAVYRINGYHILTWKINTRIMKELIKYSWPLILSGVMIAIYMKIDQIILGDMLGNEAVGLYASAVRISEVWYFVPGTIVSSVFPFIVHAKHEGKEIYFKKILQLYKILIWIALVVAIIVTFLANDIIMVLYGAKYAGAGTVLAIHIWTAVFVFYGVGKNVFIQCENMQFFSFICTVLGASLSIILNIVLIGRYGVVGAAVAALCAQTLSAIVIPSFYYKDRISVKLFFKSFCNISELWKMRTL
ncbi:MAG: flippase [Nitrospiraceae bacterium]|nr:flippase [Nitrospiraceae bacterium]